MPSRRVEAALLESKLFPAAGTGRPLPRPRIDAPREVLEGTCPVAVLTAPAGYGKSTLMVKWHAGLTARGVASAWLSLDEDDDDPVRFMRYLVAALQTADRRVGKTVAGALAGSDVSAGGKAVLESLASDLAKSQRRVVLFLDDLQRVRQPEVIDTVAWLVNYAPHNVQIVIGSREEPNLRLAALRVRRQLFEIDLQQMRFDLEEVAHFCRSRLGRDLSESQLRRLVETTEGWPAALELAMLALEDANDPAALVENLEGTDRRVVDYLGEVLLARMDQRNRTFVSCIALFDRFDAALARAASKEDGAAGLLDELRARNLFLIPLDRAGEWMRFHHLVGAFFRERFIREQPSQARDALVRGAHWLHAAGYVEEAIQCALRAQDWEQATRWVAACVEEVSLLRGQHETVLRWMNALPSAWVDRYPVIRAQYAFTLSFYSHRVDYEGQVQRLQVLLETLEADAQADAAAIGQLRCAVEFQDALATALRDDGVRGGELAAEWLARWTDAPIVQKGVMGNVRAFGHKVAGDIERGLAGVAETRRWLEGGENQYGLAWTACVEALLHLECGDWIEARSACEDGLELIERTLHGHPAHAGVLHSLLAAISYEFDELADAGEHMEFGMSSVDDYAPADVVILAYRTRARLQRLRHDEEGGLGILRDGQVIGRRRGLRRVVLALAAEECGALVRAGRHDDARLAAVRAGFSDPLGAQAEADPARLMAARHCSLLLTAPELAIGALDAAIEHCQARGLDYRCVELLLLRAMARAREARWETALDDLCEALSLAAPRGFTRVFLDDSDGLRPLFHRLDPERQCGSGSAALARKLQQAMRQDPIAGRQPCTANAPPPEELTPRELAILKRLESGLSNKEIAESIFISEGTLKWHLHNVYGKLGVKNRSGALTRARTMGLL